MSGKFKRGASPKVQEAPAPAEQAVAAPPADNLSKIKTFTSQFKNYINQQYKANVAYTPNAEQIKLVTVNKWIKMPKAFCEAICLPGLPMGNITHIYGKPNTGKTTALMEAIVACQKQGIVPIVILTEHKFDFNRITVMGGDPDAMLVFHADTLEQAYGYMEKLLKDIAIGKINYTVENPEFKPDEKEGKGNQKEIEITVDVSQQDCYVMMDSIGNTMSISEMEYEVEDWDKSMGKAAKAIKNLTKRINYLLSKVRQQCGILLLNQSYQSMPPIGPSVETPYGGDGAPYSCVLNIRFRRRGDLKITVDKREYVIGLETIVQVMKNHVSNVMPISSVYTVGTGMIMPTDAALNAYKKEFEIAQQR